MKTEMMHQIRGIQLDLARQPETLDFIREFIDFAAENHYNVLFLYLEWRVRTKSVDLGEKQGYTADELKEIIRYAGQRSLAVIPGLATLGHSELLLRNPKYKHLSELRDGSRGRFTACPAADMDLCPSSDAVKKLLADYISEAAEIFESSEFIHIGGDEVHNVGYCPDCRRKIGSYADEQKLYLEHVKFVHGIVSGIGKRVMMWDDMLELYPDVLEGLPRDIVLVDWLYHDNVSGFLGHFFNLRFEDWFEKFDREGRKYILAPAVYSSSNVRTFTEYAASGHPAGALLTAWENVGQLMYKYYPSIAMAGQTWGGSADDCIQGMRQGVKQIFGIEEEPFFHAVETYAGMAQGFPAVTLSSLTTFNFFGPDNLRQHSMNLIESVLTGYRERVRNPLGALVLQDILLDCRFQSLKMRCAAASWRYFRGMAHEPFDLLKREIETAYHEYIPFYRQCRPDNAEQALYSRLKNSLNALDRVSEFKSNGYLAVLFALPDGYGAEWTRIFVNGNPVGCSCYKLPGATFYEVNLPVAEKEIREVRFETVGFGGQGIAYVSGKTPEGTYVPAGVASVSGLVEHAEMILRNDACYAYLGLRDIMSAYRDRNQGEMVSSVTVTMRKME